MQRSRAMPFYADLHIHSKYSRACSRDCDLEHLARWARRKGIRLVGTGDFTHPAWLEHLRESLVPAEPGLFRLGDDMDKEVCRSLPPACDGPVRFMLSVEISTIYKRADRTRKVHHLVYVPDFPAAERLTRVLSRIGNLSADGRPILGLDSRDLLEITLESSPDSYLVPAHVWTPWFSALGSKSGFDAIADCYADLSEHIFALETGLSSDPPMNWRVSALDRYRLISNSDAHSPPMLGREACLFDTDLDYVAVRRALETGEGYRGSVEFFPEEGKYHLDGHRKCGVRLEPSQTRERDGRCPVCGKPLTVGVLHRVEELADRCGANPPEGAASFRNLVPLPEIVGEIRGVGPKSKTVANSVSALTARFGSELTILEHAPLDELAGAESSLLAEAIRRLRRGEVIREAGYDGEYGTIRLFEPGEITRAAGAGVLFDIERPLKERDQAFRGPARVARPDNGAELPTPSASNPPLFGEPETLLDGLDEEQRRAASINAGPLLIVAGPGSGKTRTLTHRIAHLISDHGVPPDSCLAITFTRRAAEEMRERLAVLIPENAERVTVTTFHRLGAFLLREYADRAGVTPRFRIADENERMAVAVELAGTVRDARRMLSDPAGDAELRNSYKKALRERDLVDFDDLLSLPVEILSGDPELAARWRDRFRYISVDEYQDIDETQYRLLKLLTTPDGDVCAIGDPDQSIYRFRGADVGFFLRFRSDYPAATVITLSRNYRSTATIVAGARDVIASSTLVPGRELCSALEDGRPIEIETASDEADEAEFVARRIDQLLGGSSFHSLDSGRADGGETPGLAFSDIAILYRTDAQAKPIMETLTRAGMPFQKRSHDRLADRPGVQELLSEIRHIGNARLRDGVKDAMSALISRLPEDREPELRTAADLLAPLADRCQDDMERFLTELALGAEVDIWDPRADRISLLTLHAAKGLEFPVVFIVGCEDGLLPLRFPGEPVDENQTNEERRLFFVGMTRARDQLMLSRARRRGLHGRGVEPAPSPFLGAIARGLVERRSPASGRARVRDRQLALLPFP